MLSGKEKRYLRGIASTRKAIVQVGKEGISSNLVDSLDVSLSAHELVKVTVLKNCEDDFREIVLDLASLTHSEVVQTIGRTFVLYRRSKKNLMGL